MQMPPPIFAFVRYFNEETRKREKGRKKGRKREREREREGEGELSRVLSHVTFFGSSIRSNRHNRTVVLRV